MEEKGRLRFPSHTGRTRSFAKPQPWIRADIFVPECRDRAASSRELQASLAFVGASESRVDRRREGWYDSVVDESWQATIENLDPSRVESLSRFTSRTETRPPSPSFFVYRNRPPSLCLDPFVFFTEIFAVSFRPDPIGEEISSLGTLCKNVAGYRRGETRNESNELVARRTK